jgi:thiol:disulfide interchange protein
MKNILLNVTLGLTVLTAFVVSVEFFNINQKESTINWNQNNTWDGQQNNNTTQIEEIVKDEEQIIAQNYQEAIEKSAELNKPVLVFFSADWCSWCHKMKSQIFPKESVKKLLKNYILVFVDVDDDPEIFNNHDYEYIPAYSIIDAKEKILKKGSGFKNEKIFGSWLNNPELYNLPQNNVVTK